MDTKWRSVNRSRTRNWRRTGQREVIRIVTPGTNTDIQALDEGKNNYIMCIVYVADKYGLSIADVSTGDYFVTEVENERKLLDEINKFSQRRSSATKVFI